MSKANLVLTLSLISLMASTSFYGAFGHHDGVPTFLGIWSQTYNTNRIIDTSLTTGEITIDVNITNAHRGGVIGTNGFDFNITYNSAILRARSAGIGSFPLSASAPIGESVVYSSDTVYNTGELVLFGSTTPPTAGLTGLKDDGNVRYRDADNNNIRGGTEGIVYDANGNAVYDATDDPKIKYRNNIVVNSIWDPGESVVYSTNGDAVYDAGEPVISGPTPPPGTTGLLDDAKIKFVDIDFDGTWDSVETVVYDQNADGSYIQEPVLSGTAPQAGRSLEDTDSKIKYVDSNNNDIRDANEVVIYSTDGDLFYDAGEPVIGPDLPAPAAATAVEDTDLKIKYVDTSNNNLWAHGESVVYDSNSNGVYDSGEPVIADIGPATGTLLREFVIAGVMTNANVGNAIEDTDPAIKYFDFNDDNVWRPNRLEPTCPVTQGCVFDLPERSIVPFRVELDVKLKADGTVDRNLGTSRVFMLLGPGPNAVPNGVALRLKFAVVGIGQTDIEIRSVSRLTVGTEDIRYIKIDGFFSNDAAAPAANYRVSVSPNTATIQPTGSTTTTVSVTNVVGSPGPVALSSRVVSPVAGAEFSTNDPTVMVSFSGVACTLPCTPPFTATMSITTTVDTIRRDVGVSGVHTIIVNATTTGSAVPRGVLTAFTLTVEFPPIDYSVVLSRDLIVLRPGENSPDVRFIDADGDGIFDLGEILVLDANLDFEVDLGDPGDPGLGDTIVSTTPTSSPSPRIRFIDADTDTAYSPSLVETIIYDSNNDIAYNSGELVVGGGATPTVGTALEDDPKIKYDDSPTNDNVWTPFSDTVVYDSNNNGVYDSGEPVIDGATPGLLASLEDDPKLRYFDFNDNNMRDIRGELLVFDANLNRLVDSGDTVVTPNTSLGTPTRAPASGEIGLQLLDIGTRVGFIDADTDNLYDLSEKLVLDSNLNGAADSSPSVGVALVDDPKIKYVDANNNNIRESVEAVVYDSNANNEYDIGEPVIAGTTPSFRTPIEDTDPNIKYVDGNTNTVWNLGEAVAYDTNTNNAYNSGEPVIAGDTVVSESPPRSPAGTEIASSLKGEVNKPLTTIGEIGLPLLREAKIKYIDGPDVGTAYNPGETIVFDADNNNVVGTGDTIVSQSPPVVPGVEVGQSLLTETKIRFIDQNGNGMYGIGETLVFDSPTTNSVVDSADTVVSASTRAPLARAKFLDPAAPSGDVGRYNSGEKLVADTNNSGLLDSGDRIVSETPHRAPNSAELSCTPSPACLTLPEVETYMTVTWVTGGPETVSVVPQFSDPVDASLLADVERASGEVSGPQVAGLEMKTHVTAITINQLTSAPTIEGARIPAMYRIGVATSSDLSGISKLLNVTLIVANLGYRHDLAFDYKLTVETILSPDPAPSSASVSGNVLRIDRPTSGTITFTVRLVLEITQGIPQDTTIAVMVAPSEPTVVVFITEAVIRGTAPGFGTVKDDPKIKYRDVNNNDVWDPGELVFYDSNNNGVFETGELVFRGTAPGFGTVKDDPKIKYRDVNNNDVWDSDAELVFYDSNNDGAFETGIKTTGPFVASFETTFDVTISSSTPRVVGGYTIMLGSPAGATPADESAKLCVLFQGDANNDGTVNILDLVLGGVAFGKSTGQPGFNPDADVNGDGTINILDLVIMGVDFGKSC